MRKYFAHLSNFSQIVTEENLLQKKKKKNHHLKFPISTQVSWLDICFQKHQRVDSDLPTWARLIEPLLMVGSLSLYQRGLLVFSLLSSKQPVSEKELLLPRNRLLLLLEAAAKSWESCFYAATVSCHENNCTVITLAFQLYNRIKEETMMRVSEGNATSTSGN